VPLAGEVVQGSTVYESKDEIQIYRQDSGSKTYQNDEKKFGTIKP